MADRSFPSKPSPLRLRPVAVERIVPHEPLRAIGEVASITIHDIVNDSEKKRIVARFWRIRCRIANEDWLRRNAPGLRPGAA